MFYLLVCCVSAQEVFTLVNPDKYMSSKWRREAAESGCHSQISARVPRTLESDVANALRDLDIDALRVVDLQELARILGVSASGRKEDLKLRLAPLIHSINSMCLKLARYTHNRFLTFINTRVLATGTAILSMDYPSIPWVFTKEQINLVDTRCKRIVLPSNCPAFCTTKAGIFEDSSAFWRLVSNYMQYIRSFVT